MNDTWSRLAVLAGMSVLMALVSAFCWVWGTIAYSAVHMYREGLQPPRWMIAFFAEPLSAYSLSERRKVFLYWRWASVVMLAVFLAEGLFLVPPESDTGWRRDLVFAIGYFLPMTLVWLAVVLGFKRYLSRRVGEVKRNPPQ